MGEGVSRRTFLAGVGIGIGAATLTGTAASGEPLAGGAASALPAGKALRVLPALVYGTSSPQDKSSWRSYGSIQSKANADGEVRAIEVDLKSLAAVAEFPLEWLPVSQVGNADDAAKAAQMDADAIILYAAGGPPEWFATLAASNKPNIMFLRHRSGAYYLYHEIAHWRFLRQSDDAFVEPNMDANDIVVDDLAELAWRLRALYAVKNARGTKMLAIGSLAAYSAPGQELGPKVARDVWGYEVEIVPHEEFKRRLDVLRADPMAMQQVRQDVADFLARPNLKLETEKRFVENSFLAFQASRTLMAEKGAFNIGFDRCMGREIIEMLDTPPCLVLALINDSGLTGYCHTDLTHTMPGVLMRWISGKPTFVCNTHFPYDGVFTVAHCAAPMKMNGRDNEPVTVKTHYESDYGAATKVEYTHGQEVTVVVSSLHCNRWHGFRGNIVDAPSLPACRSQMDIKVNGDWQRLRDNMEGFHAQIVYGDYLREIGYALKKNKAAEWVNYSA